MKIHLILLSLVIALSACQKETEPPEAPAISEELLSVFKPVEATDISESLPELRQNVQPGDDVAFKAKVMGADAPFVEGRALVVMGDEAVLQTCDLMEGDTCKTPWDACCEPREHFKTGTVTVQVVDADGKVLSYGLKGVNGLKELSRVHVQGVVAPMSTEDALVINATAIEVLP